MVKNTELTMVTSELPTPVVSPGYVDPETNAQILAHWEASRENFPRGTFELLPPSAAAVIGERVAERHHGEQFPTDFVLGPAAARPTDALAEAEHWVAIHTRHLTEALLVREDASDARHAIHAEVRAALRSGAVTAAAYPTSQLNARREAAEKAWRAAINDVDVIKANRRHAIDNLNRLRTQL